MTRKIRTNVLNIAVTLKRHTDAHIFSFKGDYQTYGTHDFPDQSG